MHNSEDPSSSSHHSTSGHPTADASRTLSAIAESDENCTTSHTGGMEPIPGASRAHSPGGDSVTSAMHRGGGSSSSAPIVTSNHSRTSPPRHSPSPVSFQARPVAPQGAQHGALGEPVATRKVVPVPSHLLGDASRTFPTSRFMSPQQAPLPEPPQHALPVANLPSAATALTGQCEVPATAAVNKTTSGADSAGGADSAAFAPSPLSHGPAPSRAHSPSLRPTLSPGSASNPLACDAADVMRAASDEGVPNPCVSPTSQEVRNDSGVRGSRSPSCVRLGKGGNDATDAWTPHSSPPRPQCAQRTVSPQRFKMPPSASMHVQHGGIVLPKVETAGGSGGVDTHAPHALKVHCATWNMGRMKVTSQLAVNLRGAFLGVPRGEQSSKGPTCVPPDTGKPLAAASWSTLSVCVWRVCRATQLLK